MSTVALMIGVVVFIAAMAWLFIHAGGDAYDDYDID